MDTAIACVRPVGNLRGQLDPAEAQHTGQEGRRTRTLHPMAGHKERRGAGVRAQESHDGKGEQTVAYLRLRSHLPISDAPRLWESRDSGSEDS